MNHGTYVSEKATSVSTPVTADCGLPFVVGSAPVQAADNPTKAGIPVLCTSWDEAVEQLGYSDDWKSYTLCEFMYSHFRLFGCQPVVFCNVLDLKTMKTSVAAEDVEVIDHKATLPLAAINDENLTVKMAGGEGEGLVKDVDYSVYYNDETMTIEALPDGSCYDAAALNVTYNKVTPEAVDADTVVDGIEGVEMCMSLLGTIPDLLCAPGFSSDSVVAAVLATKAANLTGLFAAKALIDIDCSAEGATRYTDCIALKNEKNLVDEEQILCWPQVQLGKYRFHMSTQLAGLMAQVDAGNGCPYESPSNKNYQMDAMVLEDGSEVNLTLNQANILNANGIVTALNFMGQGWVCWGDWTACYPANTDVKDYFIPVSRMFDWVHNTLIRTFWSKVDKPMNRRLLDTIVDTCNIWLNGLVGSGYLLGARAEALESENPETSLMAGIVTIHVYMTPPSPAVEIDFVLEYDVDYVSSALLGEE